MKNLAMILLLLFITVEMVVAIPVTLTAIQAGEVFDGQNGPLDGVGDAKYVNTCSYFGPGYSAIGWLGDAMAYFDLTSISGQTITSAVFEWDVHHTQGNGAPSSTGVYGMLNDSSLSLDDYGKGTFWGSVQTAGFTGGDTVTLDITNFLQAFSGTSLGIRFASLDATGNTFMNMNNSSNARIIFNATPSTVPEPSTLLLLGTVLIGLAVYRRK